MIVQTLSANCPKSIFRLISFSRFPICFLRRSFPTWIFRADLLYSLYFLETTPYQLLSSCQPASSTKAQNDTNSQTPQFWAGTARVNANGTSMPESMPLTLKAYQVAGWIKRWNLVMSYNFFQRQCWLDVICSFVLPVLWWHPTHARSSSHPTSFAFLLSLLCLTSFQNHLENPSMMIGPSWSHVEEKWHWEPGKRSLPIPPPVLFSHHLRRRCTEPVLFLLGLGFV